VKFTQDQTLSKWNLVFRIVPFPFPFAGGSTNPKQTGRAVKRCAS